jgi:radical SAM protein with 4Fe4S-binding SPASM domain
MCRTQGCISAKGDLFPCILFRKSCGNLINQTFKELWNSEKIKIYRDYKWDMMEICNNCILKNYCFICPGFNITEGAEWNIPAVEACRTGLARMGIF